MNTYTGILVTSVALVLLVSIVAPSSYSQEAAIDSEAGSNEQYRAVFQDVQLGISKGDVRLFSRHFAAQVSVNLRGDENGTFSSNQMFYVLGNFFKSRRFAHFEFSTVGESDATPYASGEAEFIQKGNKEAVQVYAAVSFVGKKYVITQLTIY